MAGDRNEVTTASSIPPTGLPGDAALADAVKVLGDVMRNEETRFSNLNTRAVAIVSASSLVTALAGVFSKDVLGTDFKGWGRGVGAGGLALTVILLAVVAVIIVWKVLAPAPRSLFGNNPLTLNPASVTTPAEVNRIAYSEYTIIYSGLLARNKAKAEALTAAYWCLLSAVAVIALTTVLVIVARF
jgi:hypothetical protein